MGSAGTKWAPWLGVNDPLFDGLISTYEGAYYYEQDIYRPTYNSKMRSLGRPFNLPSVQALIIEIYRIVSPIDDATPEEKMLSGADIAYVVPVQPVGHVLDIEWRLDDDVIPGAEGTTLDLATLGLNSGEYTLSVIVTDNTEWVRDETARATWMTDSRSWTVLINTLASSEPPADGSLPKTQNNLVLCAFDALITLPASGNPLVIKDMTNGCVDVSHLFAYSVDADDPNGCTLEARETDPNDPNNHDVLPDMTWYQVESAPGWTDVAPFQFEVYTLVGDCNTTDRVTTADYSCVKIDLTKRGDLRADLNGSGRVTTADYSVVKANLTHRAPTKPALCP